MSWENRDRLLLAPLDKVLLCATFPEEGTSKRPTPQPPRKIRTLAFPRKKISGKNKSTLKKNSKIPTDKVLGRVSRQRRSPLLVHYTDRPPGRRAQRRPHSEQPQMLPYPQDAMETMQGKIDQSGQYHQMGSRGAR